MSTSRLHASHFASTIRCWLPPERVVVGLFGFFVLISSSLTHFSISSSLFFRSNCPFFFFSLSISEMMMLSPIDWVRKRPSDSRSSGTYPILLAIASPWADKLNFFSIFYDLTGIRRLQTKHRQAQFSTTRIQKSCNSKNLSSSKAEVNI